jgi:hypothetical protein
LSAPFYRDLTLGFRTLDGSATKGIDYEAASGTLSIPAGSTTGTITVTVYGDTAVEGNETLTLDLGEPSGTGAASATGTILDDEPPTISVADASVAEGDSGTASLAFVVTLSAPFYRDLAVGFRTADGTATSGSDYAAVAGTLTIPAGSTVGTVAVPVFADTTVEGDETLTLELSAPAGAGAASATGTIVDDDRAPTQPAILWRNVGGPDVGALFVWLMNGTDLAGATYLDPINRDWVVQQVADFNGDGHSDILWRESSTGSTYIWLMDGATVIAGTGYTSSQAGLTWQIQAAGDLNGDGRADILWRNVGPGPGEGAVFLWLMNGPTIVGATYLDSISTAWQVQRVADFNGDGKADILWRDTSGNLYMWMMDGPQVVAGTGYTDSQADNAWQVQGVGDFDGDGKADILWRNVGPGPAEGALFVWLMNGTTVKGATYLDPISTAWQVQGVLDFNADGKADILWREVSNGSTYIWMMNGPQVSAGTGYTASQADNVWQIQEPR